MLIQKKTHKINITYIHMNNNQTYEENNEGSITPTFEPNIKFDFPIDFILEEEDGSYIEDNFIE